jgi:isovaleryl-CoA dehydrogenase
MLARSAVSSVLRAAAVPHVRGMAGATLSLLGGNGVGDMFTPTEDHKQLREMVRSFAEAEVEPQATEFNRAEKFNHGLFRKLGELGLLGITADPAHGGSGMDATGAVIVHEELAAVDPAFTLSYLAHSMLFVNNLNVNGTEEQKARYLPTACTGASIGGMCMSEPAAGTDVLGMKTRAVKKGDDYVIDGAKMWITNGAVDDETLGDHFLVYARTGDKGGAGDLSLFLVEKGMPGFKLGQRIKDKCGMRASCTAELVFEGVKVPGATHLVGGPSHEGKAVFSMMRNLEIERLTLAAMSLGIARRSIEVMIKYANERIAFGQPLSRFGQIQKYIADSYAEYQAGRAYTYATAAALKLDSGGNRVDSDGVKLYCSVMGKNVADRAIQTLGGYGYVGEYNVERLWRDAKLLEIGGGTLEAHEKNMARDLSSVPSLP